MPRSCVASPPHPELSSGDEVAHSLSSSRVSHSSVCPNAVKELRTSPTCSAGSLVNGDERVRTADPLLARQVLSQLSYAPIPYPWARWAYLDLNQGPHAYQACALTRTEL